MSIRSAARALGGDVAGRNTILCPGPGHGRNDRSLSVTFDPDAPDCFIVHSFANDDWQICRDHVRASLGLGAFEAMGRPARPAYVFAASTVSDSAAIRKRDYAALLWQEARPIAGTIVETYLGNARRIDIPGEVYTGSAIRFHGACPFRLDSGEIARLPSMIAAMTTIEGNAFSGIHRTALQPDGLGKAKVRGLAEDGRMMLGSAKGAVVRLSPDENVTTGIGLAEGVETSMSVMVFGFSPMWATLSAGMLKSFPVLSGVEALTIFADNDASGVGMAAAELCAECWVAAGRECTLWTPPRVDDGGKGTDFNDLLKGRHDVS